MKDLFILKSPLLKYVNMRKLTLLALIILVIFSNCKTEKKPNVESSEKIIQVEVNIIISVFIDSIQSYTLYLPESYRSNKKLPIIFFFDPHADGKLPVNLYSELANKYNFIFVGSNNVKNGLQPNEYDQLMNNLIHHVSSNVSFNQQEIVLCGFSGGARVAGAYAQKNQFVHAVISCSASIIGNQAGIHSFPFHYMGIVGYEDFNFIEMCNEFERLQNNKLIRYLGEHNWPEPEVMEEAFLMLNVLQANSNQRVIMEALNFYETKLAHENQNIYDRFLLLKRANEVVQKYEPKNQFAEELKRISKAPQLEEYITYVNNLKGVELDKRQKYALAFQGEDLNWWKREMKIIDEHIGFSEFGEDKLMYLRLKNYFGMLGYFFTNRSLQMGEKEQMWSYLQKYEIVDPENPDVYYYKAIYYLLNNDDANALSAIKKSLTLGFKDIEKFRLENYFQQLQNNAEFKEMLDKY